MADVAIDVTDMDASVRCKDFPYRVRTTGGKARFEQSPSRHPKGWVRLEQVTAGRADRPVKVTVNGEIAGFHAKGPADTVDLTFVASDLLADDELRAAVPAPYRPAWDYLAPTPESRFNARCTIRQPRPGMKDPNWRLLLTSIDSSVTSPDFPYRLDHLTGEAEYVRNETEFPRGRWRISDIRSVDGERVLRVNGTMTGGVDPDKLDAVHLSVEGQKLPLDDRLRAALDRRLRPAYDAFHPKGQVDVTAYIDRRSGDNSFTANLFISPLSVSVLHDRFPLRVTDVTGKLQVEDGVFTARKIQGRAAGGTVLLDGLLWRGDERPVFDLTVKGKDVALGREIEEALPNGYRELFRRLGPQGKLSFTGTLRRVWVGDNDSAVDYAGVLEPQDASLKLGIDFADMRGSIRLKGTLTEKGHDFEGKLDLSSISLAGHRFDGLSGTFEKRGNLLSVYELDGKIHGGQLAAQARVDLENPVTYGIVAQVGSLGLGACLKDFLSIDDSKLDGLLSGRVLVQGQGTDFADAVGQADFRIRKGTLWQIPPVLSLLNVLNLSLPERTAFTDASARLEFAGSRLTFKELNFIGNAVSIYGEGQILPSGLTEFSFLTGVGRLAPPEIPILTPVLKVIGKQIVEVKVSGKYTDPKFEVVPVAPVTGAIKGFFGVFFPPKKPASGS
jgi:hypothetical protein